MKKTNLLLITLFITVLSYSQEYRTTFSTYTAFNFSKGFELRGEFGDWYLAFQAENFIKEREYYTNWGFSLGMMEQINRFDFIYGLRVGFIKTDQNKPSFGIETELDYNINKDVFVAVRLAYDTYFDSPNIENPTSYHMLRPFLKIGYKF